MVNAERLRLAEADTGGVPWRRWGPYLSERQWGTVREDYGSGDDTWSYFPHGQARSRAYRKMLYKYPQADRGAIRRAAAGGRTGAAR